MRRFSNRSQISGFMSRILWSVLLLALGGIIGNRADAYFISSVPEITKSITTGSILWAVIIVLLVFCFCVIWYWLDDKKNLSKLSTFDTMLDMLQPTIMSNSGFQDLTQAFIERAFDITNQYILSSSRKAQLFLPDSAKQYLISTSSYGW